jgi:hypothetical protein
MFSLAKITMDVLLLDGNFQEVVLETITCENIVLSRYKEIDEMDPD